MFSIVGPFTIQAVTTSTSKLTGKDPEVIEFLESRSEMAEFLKNVTALVDQSVNTYLRRGFTNLSVNFGCTGGQHRSVYAAEQMAKHLKNNFKVNVVLSHREQDF